MKRIKLLTPIILTATTLCSSVSLIGCSCNADNVNGLTCTCSKTFEMGETVKAQDIQVYEKYSSGKTSTNTLTYKTDYIVLNGSIEITNFDTVGYTITKDDAIAKTKTLIIKSVKNTELQCLLDVKTNYSYYPVSIEQVSGTTNVFTGDTITSSSLNVQAKMNDGTTKDLTWKTEYSVWDDNTQITDFDSKGYTFESEGTKTLTFKSVQNSKATPKSVTFNVYPIAFKNACCMTNIGIGKATITWNHGSSAETKEFKYSKDRGTNWLTLQPNTPITLNSDEILLLKGNNPSGIGSFSDVNRIEIKSEESNDLAKVVLFGSALGLIDDNDPASLPSQLPDSCFYGTFIDSNALVATSENFLGNVALNTDCYNQMFSGCSNLLYAPKLPASTLAESCYNGMFRNCTSLETAPEISATVLAKNCLSAIFQECSKLAQAPKLPVLKLEEGCYSLMFNRCESLVNAPELPATTLAANCYESMFAGCTKLSEAPALNVKTLKDSCYKGMFSDCTSLVKAPELPATTLADSCYYNLFDGCTELITAPNKLPATDLAKNCYYQMFADCWKLTNAPELPATTLATGCYKSMFYACESLTSAPKLPAKNIASNCYEIMFAYCTSITSAPELPAETMYDSCYECMFAGCSSITEAPVLPAKTLAERCYERMFAQTGITSSPELPAEKLFNYCYARMFYECKSLTKVGKISATSLADLSCISMFDTCSNLEVTEVDSTSAENYFFTCPDTSTCESPVNYMFSGTKVKIAAPTTGKHYAWK